MATRIKSKFKVTKAPKMNKTPYIGSYIEGQDTMGKVSNPYLKNYYGKKIEPYWAKNDINKMVKEAKANKE